MNNTKKNVENCVKNKSVRETGRKDKMHLLEAPHGQDHNHDRVQDPDPDHTLDQDLVHLIESRDHQHLNVSCELKKAGTCLFNPLSL